MPEIEITVGGRSFQVACQAGEEHFLRSAATMLDREAQPLVAQLGRLPESRLLLMAGLMVADRTAALEEEVRGLKEQLAASAALTMPEPVKVEVPVVPQTLRDSLAEIAARAESLADRMSEAEI
jgi:cell division protein ZapA